MFGRKSNKQQPAPQERSRRSAVSPQSASPTFSYYTSRTPDATARRAVEARPEAAAPKQQSSSRLGARIPMALLLVVVIVCAVKLLLLGTDPKVIVLGKTAVSGTYLQSNATYEAAAHKLLNGSPANHTKLTVNLNGTANQLRQQFPELQAVSMTLPLIGNRPIVYVQVAQPSVILQSTHGNYAVNKSGLILAKVNTLPSGVPVVVDQSGAAVHPGHQYLPGSTVSFIQTVAYQLNAAHLPVSVFVLPQAAPYELDVRLEGKPYVVRLSLASDALTQSGAAVATIGQLGNTTPANYVDVRVPGRVYYK